MNFFFEGVGTDVFQDFFSQVSHFWTPFSWTGLILNLIYFISFLLYFIIFIIIYYFYLLYCIILISIIYYVIGAPQRFCEWGGGKKNPAEGRKFPPPRGGKPLPSPEGANSIITYIIRSV